MTTDNRRLQFLDDQLEEAIRKQPRMAELRDRLLAIGGISVVPREEPDLGRILDRGVLRIPSRNDIKVVRGRKNDCHGSASRYWANNHDKSRIATGWGLSPDGLWRQHTWAVETTGKKRIVETGEIRTHYFGAELTIPECIHFAMCNAKELMDRSEVRRFVNEEIDKCGGWDRFALAAGGMTGDTGRQQSERILH